MQAIERIRAALSSQDTSYEFLQFCKVCSMSEVLAHIDALTAENERMSAALADTRFVSQAQGTHQAPCARTCEAMAFRIEIRGLKAENEQLRKDAERKPMHEGEIQAAWLGQGIEEPMPYTFELGIRSAERFNGIKGTP